MKTILKIVGAIVLVAALLVAAVLGFAVYANYSAEKAAQNFCATIPIGSDIDHAIARALEQGARHRGPRTIEGEELHDFEFQGWVFNVGVCRAGVANGKVTSLEANLEGD
jgi:hypothetical protein